ncbi:MAG: RloB domain-containing protein [Alphaproteobacteria bacterium]
MSFDKDDCDDEKFKKVIQQCKKAGFVDAISVPCYEYWLLLHLKKTNQPFKDAQECCETFRAEYNKKFQTQYTVKQLKAKTDIFNDLKNNLDSAIANADNLGLEEAGYPYTNMHQVIRLAFRK